MAPCSLVPFARVLRASKNIHVVVRVRRATVFPNCKWELGCSYFGVGDLRYEFLVFGSGPWLVGLGLPALCSADVGSAGLTVRNVVVSSWSAIGRVGFPTIRVVVWVGAILPLVAGLRSQTAVDAGAAVDC
ncbi:hypothetical protein HanIR_Chr14g0687551 [Helianthus annuus]|nr:hypothetical protein HanIR_Chr14g0687551 [Helianthus annuus]